MIWRDFGACDCFCFAGQSMIADTTLSSFFFFRLLPLGVTTANHLPPSHPLPPNGSFLLSIISVTSLPLLVTVPTFKGVFVYMETQNPQQFKTRLLNQPIRIEFQYIVLKDWYNHTEEIA